MKDDYYSWHPKETNRNYEGNGSQYWGPATYAQHGDDIFMLNLCFLLDIKNPTWLDLGAHHPYDISNTALLYLKGFRGVNVDANPNMMKAFEVHRPEDVNVHIGVGPKEGVLTFHMIHPLSGCNTFVAETVIAMGHKIVETVEVTVFTVNQIVQTWCKDQRFPDIMFTDIEGTDIEVLKSIDFDSYQGKPKIICTEIHRGKNDLIVPHMEAQGFKLLCRLAANLVFVDAVYYPKCF